MKLFRNFIVSRLYGDQRGAIGVLLLMTILALVAMIGLVWNTTENSVKRRSVQMAADAAGHSSALWISRGVNTVAAANMMICQNAVAETMWRAARDTQPRVKGRLDGETARILREISNIQRRRDRNREDPEEYNPYTELTLSIEESVLLQIVPRIPPQYEYYNQFVSQVAPAFAAMDADEFRERRDEVFDYQTEVVDAVPLAVKDEFAAISEKYQVTSVLATPGAQTIDGQPVEVPLPMKVVSNVNVEGVRGHNVRVSDFDPNGRPREYTVRGGYWGEILNPPMHRYFFHRLGRDMGHTVIRRILRSLDDLRGPDYDHWQLREYLYTAQQHIGAGDTILHLILDATAFSPPPGMDPVQAEQLWLAYHKARMDLLRMGFHRRFALHTFDNLVRHYRRIILTQMGNSPQWAFISYDRYPIPDWAREGVFSDAYREIYTRVYNDNYHRFFQGRYSYYRRIWKLRIFPNPERDAEARRLSREFASRVAGKGAPIIALQAATEWVNRTWPYEMVPPEEPVPPTAGISDEERLRHMTMLVAVQGGEYQHPNHFLDRLFAEPDTDFLAWAQVETYNWHEYSNGYGGGARYDKWMPPLPWRVSTRGGWSWQPRLAFTDALPDAVYNSPEFQQMLQQSKVGYDEDALRKLSTH